jgi:hypothetical protein
MVSNVKGDNLYTTMMPILYTIKQVLVVLAVPIYKYSSGHMTIGHTFIMFLSSAGLSVDIKRSLLLIDVCTSGARMVG